MRKGIDLPDTLGSIAPKKQQLALPCFASPSWCSAHLTLDGMKVPHPSWYPKESISPDVPPQVAHDSLAERALYAVRTGTVTVTVSGQAGSGFLFSFYPCSTKCLVHPHSS